MDWKQYLLELTQKQPEITPSFALAASLGSATKGPGSDMREMQDNGVMRYTVKGDEGFENEGGSFSRSEKPIAQYGKTLATALGGDFDPASRLQAMAAQGVPANLAADLVKAEYGDVLKQKSEDRDEGEKKGKWLEIADAAENAVNRAGQTGTIASDVLPWIQKQVPILDTEEQQGKRAATVEIDALFPEAMKLLKSPGSGPMSDRDLEALKKAMPSSGNTPEENAALIRALRERYGAGEQPKGGATPTPPPGMKLQVNKKTGEYRMVPK